MSTRAKHCNLPLSAVLFGCAWVGTVVTGLFELVASGQDKKAIEEENEFSATQTDKLNRIQSEQYEREQSLVEKKAEFGFKQGRIKQWENMVNTQGNLRDRLSRIFR